MSEEIELKPCPFCGGGAELMTTFDSDGKAVQIVSCKICWARTHINETNADAIADWNKRTTLHCENAIKFLEIEITFLEMVKKRLPMNIYKTMNDYEKDLKKLNTLKKELEYLNKDSAK